MFLADDPENPTLVEASVPVNDYEVAVLTGMAKAKLAEDPRAMWRRLIIVDANLFPRIDHW
ncbi:MAG: hypothetical protein F4X40_02140 [Chloroflexi bacterium]|nr:hypothetical protein [Chloroflexota bacterium]